MRQRRFVIANVASAFVWAPVHIYPAQLVGLSIGWPREGDWRSAGLRGAVLLAGCAVAWTLHRILTAHTR